MARALFCFEGGDLSVAESPELAADQMEVADVEAGVYGPIYDEGGRLYRCVVQGSRVRIDEAEGQNFDDLEGGYASSQGAPA